MYVKGTRSVAATGTGNRNLATALHAFERENEFASTSDEFTRQERVDNIRKSMGCPVGLTQPPEQQQQQQPPCPSVVGSEFDTAVSEGQRDPSSLGGRLACRSATTKRPQSASYRGGALPVGAVTAAAAKVMSSTQEEFQQCGQQQQQQSKDLVGEFSEKGERAQCFGGLPEGATEVLSDIGLDEGSATSDAFTTPSLGTLGLVGGGPGGTGSSLVYI